MKPNFSNLTQCSLYHFHFTRFSNPRITMHEQPRFPRTSQMYRYVYSSHINICFVAPVSNEIMFLESNGMCELIQWMSDMVNVTPYHYSLVLIHFANFPVISKGIHASFRSIWSNDVASPISHCSPLGVRIFFCCDPSRIVSSALTKLDMLNLME